MNPEKLKRIVIKEELVELTGDVVAAVILNQLLYWSERRHDFDKFILEERERNHEIEYQFTHGWIYKKLDELTDELMSIASRPTIHRRLEDLIEAGWVDKRKNPENPWDKVNQMRPNIRKIQIDLQSIGFALDRYPLVLETSNVHGETSNVHGETSNVHGETSNVHGETSIDHSEHPAVHGEQSYKETEITTEITTEIRGDAPPSSPVGSNSNSTQHHDGYRNSDSVGDARRQQRLTAERIVKAEAMGLSRVRFVQMVNWLLAQYGRTAVVDAGTELGDKYLSEAQETALSLASLGVDSDAAIVELLEGFPKDDWRIKTGLPSMKQLVDRASEVASGRGAVAKPKAKQRPSYLNIPEL
jgi:hypothetical protein